MKRLSCLPLCLTLAVLAGGASSQVMSDTVSIDLFLQNMTFSGQGDLTDNNSQIYADIIAKVNEYISPIGGERENIIVSDGGNCVKVNIAWRNGNQTILAEVVEKLKKDGFTIWNQTWGVSFTSCADASLLRFKFYVVNMTWSDNFRDQASIEYQQLNQAVVDTFSYLGGKIHALEIAQNYGCLELYVEWESMNSSGIVDLITELATDGITVNNQKYGVQTRPCSSEQSETTLLRFRFYVVNLPWSENFRNHNSTEYQLLMQNVKDAFTDLGGSIHALEIAQNSNCLELYVEWEAMNSSGIVSLTTDLTTNGITVNNQKYGVQTRACSAETTLLRFKFYVVDLPWSESFRDHNSTEYQQLMQNVKGTFTDLGGSIHALEIAQNSGCIEFYVEWDAVNSTSIVDITASMRASGLELFGQHYMVESTPCKVSLAETTLLRFKFYVVKMQWSANFKDHTSAEYQELMNDVVSYFSGLGGSIHALEIVQNYGCLEFYMEWSAVNATSIIDFMSVLNAEGITVLNGTYSVQSRPCEISAAEVDECAQVPKGTVSACVIACATDNSSALQQCSEGFKCCSTGCGRTCQRVGYVLKINSVIMTNLNPVDSTSDQYNSVFSQLQTAVKVLVQRNFNVEIPNLVTDVELTDISQYSVHNQNLTVLKVALYLSQNVPNENLKPCRDRLMKDHDSIEYGSFNIIDLRFGSNSVSAMPMCDGRECYGICKEFRSSVKYCSCNLGYMGSNCATFDCRTGANFSTDGNSMCQNGGECARKPDGLDYECQCHLGTTGPLCQVDLNSCPLLTARRPGLLGLCQSTCDGDNCEENHKCCKVSCGGTACVEVGFKQMLTASVTVEFPFTAELNSTNSMEYQILKPQLESWINTYISRYNLQGFKSAKIVSLQSSLDEQVTRKRRELGNTIIHLELRFTEDVPVEDMFKIQNSLIANGFDDGMSNWPVLNSSFGTEGGCPYLSCASGSFCVTNFGGDVQCACPKHRSGQLCDVMNCRPEGIDVCKNGGKCNYSNTDMQMFCECPAGYSGELCEEMTDVCAMGLCINGGTCLNLPGGGHYCACPKGFTGSVCENAANHCPSGQPLMTTSGERHCYRQACPVGFMCNVDPLDRWTACCIRKDVLCDLNPCKEGSTCVSDFNSGMMCLCPIGRKGLFCEEVSNDTTVPTACQSKQLFNDWVINILKTGASSVVTLEDLRVILQHMGYKYFPTDICDEKGDFKTMAQGVLVVNPSAERVTICMDKSGNYDSTCGAAICDVLSNNGSMAFCINGGRCIGDITQKLCDCMGTGFHGIRCELTGEDTNGTDCKLRQEIAYLALGILNGSVDLMLGPSSEATQAATREILSLYNTNNIFVPYCDEAGRYEYRGCLYMTADISKKNCYCALDDGTMFGSEENPWEPPQNCRKGSCPKEWGEECEQPEWWCLDTVQCQPDTQRCAYFTGCNDTACKQEAEVGCAMKGIILPCDPHPCQDDPFSMCQPCGIHGSCFNMGSANKTANMGYRCECKMGFSGPDCRVNDNVCASIPKDLCESECIGDINHGELCKCEPGYGGIFCNKPARSLCEKQKALFDDAISILNSTISPFNGHSVEEMQSLVRFIVQAVDAEAIQVVNCTEKGFYAKVQCSVSVNNLDDKECTCVDFYGNKISSNVKPYIGYDICTTPSDPQALAESACNVPTSLGSGELSVCLNGGSCAFDMYAGKYCSCPLGYYGQFCQHQGDPSAFKEPRSICEFFAEAWNTAHNISTGKADWISTDSQMLLYLNLSLNFLKMQDNESYALKAECYNDGTFKPAACYFNIMTGEKGPCYCWNLKGLLVEGPPVESSESSECTASQACYNCHRAAGQEVYRERDGLMASKKPFIYTDLTATVAVHWLKKENCNYTTSNDRTLCGNNKRRRSNVRSSGVIISDGTVAKIGIHSTVVAHYRHHCPALHVMITTKYGIINYWKCSISNQYDSKFEWTSVCDMGDSSCPKMKCRYICDHGYRVANSGCRTCDCKNPCEDITCDKGQRCVIEKSMPCDMEGLEMCGQAVCRSADKPGACPGYSAELYPDGLLAALSNISFCNVTCYDDTDCEGEQKCCGLCGNTCVQPQATNSCGDYQLKMQEQLQFMTLTRGEYLTTRSQSPADIRMFERITISHIWIPSCEYDGNQFKPLQCEHDISYSGDLGNISSCFCVDHWGMRIEGAQANLSDPSSCDIKPYTCPFVDIYSDTAETCSRDLDCAGNEKCCGEENQVCQTPVDAATLTTTIDTFMSTLCEKNDDMCQGGSQCVGSWMDKGIACQCPNNRTGPFCEHLVHDGMNVPSTTCERKYFALQVFAKEFDGTNSSLNLNKRLFSSSADNMKISIITTVMYNCTDAGGFEPQQCIVDAYNMDSTVQCFCVFENGTEIPGTRKPVSDGQSVFCGGNNMTCPRGKAYHGNTGELQLCEGKSDCPDGYVCHRSTYGVYYCCPPDEGEIVSDCMSKQREALRSTSLKRAYIDENDCGMTHIPACEADGTWSREQCNSVMGVCWCVSPKGHYINNTITRSVPQCQTVSESLITAADLSQTDVSQVNFSVCNNGEDFHCCNKALCRQMCWAHPEAVCHINPCGECKAEYYTSDGKMVDCNEDLTPCEQEQKQAIISVQQRQINVALTSGADIDDVDSTSSSQVLSKARSLSKDYPEQCQLPPVKGPCKGFMPQWYFDSASGSCDMFVYGMCSGNDNRFTSPQECYANCSASSNPCQNKTCSSSDKVCKLKYSENCYVSNIPCNVTAVCIAKDPLPYLVKDVFVPSCQETGEYNYKQCQGSYCWCVNSTGHYVNGLTVEQSSVLTCTESGSSQEIPPLNGTCPSGQQLNMSCMSACTNKVCPSQPEAICVVDLCSSNCITQFVDAQGQEVECTGDLCEVFSYEAPEQCTDPIPCPGMSVKTCSESICELALKQNCSNNPCAVCMLDPCTCQPYFVDAKTHNRLTTTQCTYLSVGLCEAQACSILNKSEEANYQNNNPMMPASVLPTCDAKGIYQAQQCQDSNCQCVDQFGMATVKNADGSCKAIDKIKRIKATFTYKADFNYFKSNNKLQTLREMLLKKLTDAGIDPLIIKNPSEPYAGSIKVDVPFEDVENSNNKDLAMVSRKMDMMARSRELDLTINGQNVALSNITQEMKTESQVAAENEGEKTHTHSDGDGLDTTEKIIIGVVCGSVGLLVICIITFCLCYKRRGQKKALDDSFEHVRVHDSKKLPSDSPIPVYNKVYEEDENTSMKVR